jgi:Pyruvate/2-oxoacid:ferredoxin oxidoreductase delta subunit
LTRSGNRVKPTEKVQYRIPSRSSKKVKEDALYTVMRKVFLDQHPMCMMAIPGKCTQTATDIQHKKGRGEYFLDTTTWMSACRGCHSYADTHPEEAIEKGWAELRLTPKE